MDAVVPSETSLNLHQKKHDVPQKSVLLISSLFLSTETPGAEVSFLYLLNFTLGFYLKYNIG